MKNLKQSKSAFSFVEIMVAILVVTAIIAAIASTYIDDKMLTKVIESKAKSDLRAPK